MIISGKELSAQLKDEMKAQVATFPEKYGRVPHLVVILVGEDPGSVSYVTGKAKASEYVGIRNTTIRKPDTISEAELLGISYKDLQAYLENQANSKEYAHFFHSFRLLLTIQHQE